MEANGKGPTGSGQASNSDVDSTPKDQSQDQIQALIFNLLSYPPQTFSARYKSLSRTNIAEFLGLSVLQVAQVFDSPSFLDELYSNALGSLHIHRASVDSVLLESAKMAGRYGAADRKLYYQMLGALDGKAKKPEGRGVSALSREQKEKAVMAYFSKFSKQLKSKELLEDDKLDPQPVDPAKP
jgi:hypothetical protein